MENIEGDFTNIAHKQTYIQRMENIEGDFSKGGNHLKKGLLPIGLPCLV